MTARSGRREAEPLLFRGPSGIVRVWLGGYADPVPLEADVRTVCELATSRPALAVGLGDVARRRGLEVRVIPRLDEHGPLVLAIFGKRGSGSRNSRL